MLLVSSEASAKSFRRAPGTVTYIGRRAEVVRVVRSHITTRDHEVREPYLSRRRGPGPESAGTARDAARWGGSLAVVANPLVPTRPVAIGPAAWLEAGAEATPHPPSGSWHTPLSHLHR